MNWWWSIPKFPTIISYLEIDADKEIISEFKEYFAALGLQLDIITNKTAKIDTKQDIQEIELIILLITNNSSTNHIEENGFANEIMNFSLMYQKKILILIEEGLKLDKTNAEFEYVFFRRDKLHKSFTKCIYSLHSLT